ncbi:hypothetical protein H5410_013328 [Solanum commersonii]|uniref:KIB1-4 beta-propeller domain-containing protein n=1 Tax=Solanum commersonii TaxID=4109 RepID=A0A9J6AU96_SOLCO|nr:hypothetical protein H5410_013328 [Solanum commersonii]
MASSSLPMAIIGADSLLKRSVISLVEQSQPEPDGDPLFQGWLCYIQQKDYKMFLYNPISGKIIYLPSVETLHDVNNIIRNSQSVDEDDLDCKSFYCWHTDYLVYDDQTHELFIVTCYTTAGIDQEDETLIPPEDNLDDQYPYQTLAFYVFKLDFINDNHVELQYLHDTFADHAFFIGSNIGFALSTTQFPELRPNSIYFTNNQTWAYKHRNNLNYGGHDLGIYDYKVRNISSCYYPVDLDKLQRILPAPIWFIPDVDAECLA